MDRLTILIKVMPRYTRT